MKTARLMMLATILSLAACSRDIYLRDGVTDGDTFYLSPKAMMSTDPETQSWVSYSLTISACQLTLSSTNPSRASSYACELIARRHLLETWSEQLALASEDTAAAYLDQLQQVTMAGFLREYVSYYHARRGWGLPSDLRMDAFRQWRRDHLQGHRSETRLKGSWGYPANHAP